jgi:putative GTP pyrophosphokinase
MPTKGEVDRAAVVIRSSNLPGGPEYDEALSTLSSFRAVHAEPLNKAYMGVKSVVTTLGHPLTPVTQRLKRLPTIVDKIQREPTMKVSRMQDIGGCRAVLPSIDACYEVSQRLLSNRSGSRLKDYIETPRESGYRGLHVIVKYLDGAGEDRTIEVQLRTKPMHQWAIRMEDLAARLKTDIKSGIGPESVLELMKVISQAMALTERDQIVDDGLLDQMAQLRSEAEPYLHPIGN